MTLKGANMDYKNNLTIKLRFINHKIPTKPLEHLCCRQIKRQKRHNVDDVTVQTHVRAAAE